MFNDRTKVRDSMLEAWLLEGEDICIVKRGRPIGMLAVWRADASARPVKPDIAARRRAIWVMDNMGGVRLVPHDPDGFDVEFHAGFGAYCPSDIQQVSAMLSHAQP